MPGRTIVLTMVSLLVAASLAGCKLVKNEGETGTGGTAQGSKLDTLVDEMWRARVVPHFEERAVDLAILVPAVGSGLEAAGLEYGYRAGGEGTPWTFATRFSGRVVAANTETRAATATIDIDGDGTADATVQLGRVIRGTALRDALPFVSFTDFADQIEFAGFSRALNSRAYAEALEALPRETLEGRTLSGVGAFTMRGQTDEILITPIAVEIGPAP
ncbi:DUF2291 family protein [Chelativorans xinjiangense]|uniref:DUF2291 family protein n=1 Tax=Chelativorans xinjiangense TaxID=2681485 RepID=UPI00135C3721|nr:DUF2291 domain-containing protein [Chelativorans xinjiangense]